MGVGTGAGFAGVRVQIVAVVPGRRSGHCRPFVAAGTSARHYMDGKWSMGHINDSRRVIGKAESALRFTLVELLVVIAIIAVLASLLLPSLRRARSTAHQAVCLSNLRQIGIAAHGYADDGNGYLPGWHSNGSDIPDGDLNWTVGRKPNWEFVCVN